MSTFVYFSVFAGTIRHDYRRVSDANVSLFGDINKQIREKFNEKVIFMKKSVLNRVQSFVEDTGETKNSLANKCGMAPQTFWRYVNGDNKITVSLLESLLEVFPDLSAEWLLRGEGERYISDFPEEGDTEKVEDLKTELTRVRAERDEYKQIIEELKKQAEGWRESNEYKQTIADLRVEAAELRARLDEQRTNFRILAESMGRPTKPTPLFDSSTGTIQIIGANASPRVANAAKRAGIRAAVAEAKAAKTKKNIG